MLDDQKVGPAGDPHQTVTETVDPARQYRFIYMTEPRETARPFALVTLPGVAESVNLGVSSWTMRTAFTYAGMPRQCVFLLYDPWDQAGAGLNYLQGVTVTPAE